jgi:hypothetical protein
MKGFLEFDLNDLDDTLAYKRCVKATDMALALFEIQVNLRKQCEAKLDSGIITDPYQVLEMIMDEVNNTINDHHIDVDDLIN